jgi:hypothetical protein
MLKLVAAIVIAGTLGSFTDWLFMGVLFHDAYNRYPEVWRPGVRDGKSRGAIIMAALLGYLMTAAVVVLCAISNADSIGKGMVVGALAWLAGPLVVIVVNNAFVKIDGKITFAHCVGYGARLLLAGAAAGIALA